ncbi:unnamed protein product [Arabidopsis halleri]
MMALISSGMSLPSQSIVKTSLKTISNTWQEESHSDLLTSLELTKKFDLELGSLDIFDCISLTWVGDKGFKQIRLLLWIKVYSLVRPQCDVFLSNCQGRPNNRWLACIGTTSHKTWSW